MALGGLQNEADLRRFIEQTLRTPGVLPPDPRTAISLIKSGVPVDDDFPNPPGNGVFAVDSSGPTLYMRVGGSWELV